MFWFYFRPSFPLEDDVSYNDLREIFAEHQDHLIDTPFYSTTAGTPDAGDCPPCFNCLLPAFSCGQVSVAVCDPWESLKLNRTAIFSSVNVTHTTVNVVAQTDGEDKIV